MSPQPTMEQHKSTPSRRSRGAQAVGVIGEILLTLGVVILLFVLYQLWWTDILAQRNYEATQDELRNEWGIEETSGEAPKPVKPQYGKTFGLVYVPALGDKAWGIPIVEGTDRNVLMNGLGHHEGTAVPGELGNFTLAGHRTTYGAPLHNIETLKKGDQVIVETKNGWYIYELDSDEIIKPWDSWILDPVPGLPDETKPNEAFITMYSCHPKFSDAERYVWFGHLVDEYKKSDGTPPAIQEHGKK